MLTQSPTASLSVHQARLEERHMPLLQNMVQPCPGLLFPHARNRVLRLQTPAFHRKPCLPAEICQRGRSDGTRERLQLVTRLYYLIYT